AAPGQEPWPLPTDLVGALCATVFELAEGQPLLICVDDVHHADPFSLQWLLFLIRRLGTARITVVLAERTAWQHPQPAFHAELLRQPTCHRIQLGPLTHHGIIQLLQTRLDAPSAAELAGSFDALTGGNPLLAHALLEDLHAGTRVPLVQRAAALGAGYAFCRAVVSCLHRSEAAALAVARGIAILGDNATAHLLAQLLDLSEQWAQGVVEGLESAGLLDKGQFRHPAVRDAVLRDVPATDLSALRHAAAHLLYTQGAPERDIADLLLACEERGEAWSTGLLCDVAREALFEGDAALARRCVEHAYRACSDPRQRGRVLTLMVGVEWQLQPGNATRLLPMLTAALNAGDLSDRHSVMVVKYLLRHGRITDACAILDKILVRDTPAETRTTAELRTIKLQLSSSYPGALAELPPFGPSPADEERAPAAVRADPQLQAAAVLDEVLGGRAKENTYLGAEQVLRSTRLSYRSFEQVEFALLALIYGDQEARAAACCEQLLDRAADTAAQGWRPPLLALRSLIAVRQGHLAAAEGFAATALEEMPWQGWGVTVGLPLASLLMARTAMGKYEEAAELLNRPVPQAIYKTRYGLHYLHARGEYRLATNNPHAALEDF
ncbi:tetratricopeptide (TPR) repeat protein, partial [Streptacidiphilus sp. MAP12-16]